MLPPAKTAVPDRDLISRRPGRRSRPRVEPFESRVLPAGNPLPNLPMERFLLPQGLDRPFLADVDRDGIADRVLYRPSTAQWFAAPSSGRPPIGWARNGQAFGAPGLDIPMLADVDGDGVADRVVYRPTTAEWFAATSSGRPPAGWARNGQPFGATGLDVPFLADVDGDGVADRVLYRPTTAQWFAATSSGRIPIGWASNGQAFGAPGLDLPMLANVSGSGVADRLLFRPTTAQWLAATPTGGVPPGWAANGEAFGAPGLDIPMLADVDGDGLADRLLYRPSTAEWFSATTTGGVPRGWLGRVQAFGQPGLDVPLVGDVDGDGVADRVVYRPTTAEWFAADSAARPPVGWSRNGQPFGASVAGAVAIAPGVWADGGGQTDAAPAVQAAIDETPVGGTLALPPGTYLIGRALEITRPMTLTTLGLADSSRPDLSPSGRTINSAIAATLKAAPWLAFGEHSPARDQNLALLAVHPPPGQATVSDVTIHHVILDGNQDARTAYAAGASVGDQFNCANINMQYCKDCVFRHNVSIRGAPRGNDPYSDVFVDADGLKVFGNLFDRNGFVPPADNPPSYFGRTLAGNSFEFQSRTGDVRDVVISHNRIYDQSGLGLVISPGSGTTITGEVSYNEIKQFDSMSWGPSLLLYASGQGSLGDGSRPDPKTTLLVHHNLIDGNASGATIPGTATRLRMSPFGILIGVHPYFHDNNPEILNWRLLGGRIYDNTVLNTQVGIAVDGAGTPAAPVYVLDNFVGGDTALLFNKAPETLPGVAPSDVRANSGFATADGRNVFQAGPAAEYPTNDPPPHYWGNLDTHGGYNGSTPEMVRVAPKPIASPSPPPAPTPIATASRAPRQRSIARSEGLTPFLWPPSPIGVGRYSPTRSTSALAGIRSSRPRAQ